MHPYQKTKHNLSGNPLYYNEREPKIVDSHNTPTLDRRLLLVQPIAQPISKDGKK